MAGRSMPGQGLEHKAAGRHQGTGIAGAHTGVGTAIANQIDRNAHRGVFLLAQRFGRWLIHGHHLPRIDDLDTRRQSARTGDNRLNNLALPDQNDAHARPTAHELQ